MDRIQPYDIVGRQVVYGGNDQWANENVDLGVEGSVPPVEALVHPQEEILRAIELSGQTPDKEDLEQLWKAMLAAASTGGAEAAAGFNRRLIFAPGTTVWTPPAGVTLCFVQIWGGGGGGGGSSTSGGAGAGGGGGGYYANFVVVEPGVGINVTVGQGGRGGFQAAAGEAGGTSLFGTFAGAYGGTGGGGSSGGVGRPVGRAGRGFGATDASGNPSGFLQGGSFGGTAVRTGGNLWAGGAGGESYGTGYSPNPVGAVGDGQIIPYDPEYIVPNIGQGGPGASNPGYGLSGQYGLIIVDYREPEA